MKDTFFFLAVIVLFAAGYFLLVLLPEWIKLGGASLGLWTVKLPEPRLTRVRKALEILTAAETSLTAQGAESLHRARTYLDQALKGRGFYADHKLNEAHHACLHAAIGASAALRGEVKDALGYPV